MSGATRTLKREPLGVDLIAADERQLMAGDAFRDFPVTLIERRLRDSWPSSHDPPPKVDQAVRHLRARESPVGVRSRRAPTGSGRRSSGPSVRAAPLDGSLSDRTG